MTHTAYIGLGSNVGDRQATLRQALSMLDSTAGIAVQAASCFIETSPVGPPQPAYLNAAAILKTDLSPQQLLARLQAVEATLGRNRAAEQRWGPRTCDLDILLIDQLVINEPNLQVPHPRLHEREFALRPLVEIAPEVVHPRLGKTSRQMLEALTRTPGKCSDNRAQSSGLISMLGPIGVGKTTVARRLADAIGGRLLLEDYEGNPFLADAYRGRKDLRLSSQVYYLLSRVGQLCATSWPQSGWSVSDYAFLQDAIFARLWLDGQEFEAYQQLARGLAMAVHPPDVLVHLDGPVDLLLRRIADRGRQFERGIDCAFLQRLREEYNLAVQQVGCPVISVNVARRDLNDQNEFARLLGELGETLHADLSHHR